MSVCLANTSAVLLAGGFGTRVRHLLPDLPKPMAPVCGRPFLEWVVRYLSRQGIHDVVLSTGHLGEKIATHFASTSVPGVHVVCARETDPLGTAGGFLYAVRSSARDSSAWFVLNGDSLAFADLGEVVAALEPPHVGGVLIGVEEADASRYGTLKFDPARRLIRFEEKQAGSGVINAGMYLFRTEALRAFPGQLPSSFEKDVFPTLLAAGVTLKVCVSRAPFLDIGTPESLPQAAAFIETNLNQFA